MAGRLSVGVPRLNAAAANDGDADDANPCLRIGCLVKHVCRFVLVEKASNKFEMLQAHTIITSF